LWGLRKDIQRIAVALKRLAGIECQNSNDKLLSWPESKEKETEVQGSKKKEKQKKKRLDGEDEEEEAEIRGQEEDNRMEGMEKGSSRFPSAMYSVGTGSC